MTDRVGMCAGVEELGESEWDMAGRKSGTSGASGYAK